MRPLTALAAVVGRFVSSRAVLLGILIAAGAAGLAFSLTGAHDHTVVARFRDINGLVTGNEVRIAGIEAGTVQSIDIRHDPQHAPCPSTGKVPAGCDPRAQPGDSDEYAEVTLTIKDARWPLHQGTLVAVRPKGTLSNVDVTMTPGPQNAPALPDGYTFDYNTGTPATSWPVSLDAVNDVFGRYARNPQVQITDAIKAQIAEGQKIFGGNGATDLNGTLINLNPLTRDLAPLTQVLADRTPELHRLNGEFDTILREIATEDANLRGILANGNVLFSVIVAKQNDLQGTLDHAAATFTTLNLTLDGEEQNLITILQKGPALVDKVRQGSDLLFPLIDQVDPHGPQLQVLLHEFVTATGYVATDLATAKPIDTLRVDASIGSKTAYACGGYPTQQIRCPNNPPAAASASTGPTGTAASATTPVPLAGGLFG